MTHDTDPATNAPDATDDASTHSSQIVADAEERRAGSRRGFLRTIGAGAVLGAAGVGGAGSVVGTAAAQSTTDSSSDDEVGPWDVTETGVEAWELTTETEGKVPDAPEISVADDRVVVTGGYEFASAGCMTYYPRRVVYSEREDKLGVVLDQTFRHELEPGPEPEYVDCGDAPERMMYRLSVDPDELPATVVVDEQFTDTDRLVEHLDEREPAVDQTVAEYDWSLEPGLPIEESETDATATFEGDRLVVEGVLPGGPEECVTPALDGIVYGSSHHDFAVDVVLRAAADRLPGEGCDGPETATRYELDVAFAGELPPHVTLTEGGGVAETLAHPDAGPLLQNVDGYTFDATYESTDFDDEPAVSFDGESVTVRGSRSYGSTACTGVAPQAISFDTDEGRLGVVLADVDAAEYCLPATGTLGYELTVELPAEAETAVVETQFDETTRDVFRADGDGSIDLPPLLADYELTVGDGVAATEAADTEPSVTFDGDDAIVEGALTYGSSFCNEIAVTDVGLLADDGQLGVDVAARPKPTNMPHEPCTPEEVAAVYELELTAAEDERIHDLFVAEDGMRASHSVSATRDDARDLPPGVQDVTLRVGEDADDRAVEPPGPETEFTDDAFVAHGDYFAIGSSSCKTVGLERLEFATDEGRHLAITVADVAEEDRPADEDCTTDEATTRYTLEVTFEDELPRTVYCTEDQVDTTHSRTFDRGRDPVELPDGVTDYEFQERVDDGPFLAEPRVHFRDGHVDVEASLTLDGSSCTELGLLDVGYGNDAGEHLSVRVGGVYQRGESPFGECTSDPYTQKYRLVLDVETLPDAVTVDERGAEMAETVTVERESDCADTATVDGGTVCDVDGDGEYRDVTGDGAVTNSDVTTFFRNQHAPAWNERADLFDFDGDGDVGQSDVVALFESIA